MVVGLVALMSFSNSTHGPLVFDDTVAISGNPGAMCVMTVCDWIRFHLTISTRQTLIPATADHLHNYGATISGESPSPTSTHTSPSVRYGTQANNSI